MAKDDKTEKATPKRQQEARKKGQVAKSQDFNGAIVLIVGLFVISSVGPAVLRRQPATRCATCSARLRTRARSPRAAGLNGLFHTVHEHDAGDGRADRRSPASLAGVIANVAQVGFKPSMAALKPTSSGSTRPPDARTCSGTRIFFETREEPRQRCGDGRRGGCRAAPEA